MRDTRFFYSDQMHQREVHGVRRAIEWLHEHADKADDPHAKVILNAAACGLGIQLRKWRGNDPDRGPQ